MAIVLQVAQGLAAQEVDGIFQQFAQAHDNGLAHLLHCVDAVVDDARLGREICLRGCDENESRRLNHTYRGKDNPTNILSFAGADLAALEAPLGDLALCWPIAQHEAMQQRKTLVDHVAHLSVHGVLHLLGYDHQDDAQAQVMEALETAVLADLGVANPYL